MAAVIKCSLPDSPGQSSDSQDNRLHAAMMVHLLQYACAVVALSMPVSARIRQYYIGAVEEVWDLSLIHI